MSRLDEPVDSASVLYSARLTVDSHNAGHPCQCCTPDSCPQLDWARQQLTLLAPTIDRPHPTAGVARRTA